MNVTANGGWRLLDLWNEDVLDLNWRPTIEKEALDRLVAELVVFHRVAHVIVRRRPGEPWHLEIETPGGIGGTGAMYKRLSRQLSERSGFTYAVGPVKEEADSARRNLGERLREPE